MYDHNKTFHPSCKILRMLDTVISSHMDLANLITTQKVAQMCSVKFLQGIEMAEVEDMHPNLSTHLSVFNVSENWMSEPVILFHWFTS